ncbi:hypothetical protein ACFL1T_04960, partial [Chlamydiota bacterium]
MVNIQKMTIVKCMNVFLCLFFVSSFVVGQDSLLLLDDEDETFSSSVFENKKMYKINVPCY